MSTNGPHSISKRVHIHRLSQRAKKIASSTNTFLESILDVYPGKNTKTIGVIFPFLLLCFSKEITKQGYFTSLALCGLFSIVITTNLVQWDKLPSFLGTIQFSWRFLAPATACLTFCFCKIFSMLFESAKISKSILCTLLLVLFSFSLSVYKKNTFTSNAPSSIRYEGASMDREYLPFDVDRHLLYKTNDISYESKLNVEFIKTGTNIDIYYSDNQDSNNKLELPLVFYNGYEAINQNGNKIPVYKSQNGLVEIKITSLSGNIKVFYGFTTVRVIGCFLSLFSLLLYISFLLMNKKRKI